jgi:hypothetical protein
MVSTVSCVKYPGGWFGLILLSWVASSTAGGDGVGDGSEGGAGPGGFGGAAHDSTDPITSDADLLEMAGSYCALRVNRPENCVGEDAHYFSFEADLSGGDKTAISGQYCRAFGVDCAPLTGNYEGGTLSYTYTSETGSFSADLTYDADLGNLTGLGYSVHCDCYIDFYLFSIDD